VEKNEKAGLKEKEYIFKQDYAPEPRIK